MKRQVIVHDADEGGYRVEVPAITGCATQGDTMEELLQNLYEGYGCIRKFWGWRALGRSCLQRELPGSHEYLRGGPDCANLGRVPFAR